MKGEDDFEPIDPEDEKFFGHFANLRHVVVEAAVGFKSRVRDRVSSAKRPSSSVSDAVLGGVVELFNSVAQLLGLGSKDRDDK